MSSIHKILIPFDFSEASLNALEYVANFVGPERPITILAMYVSAMPISLSEEDELKEDFSNVLKGMDVRLNIEPEFQTATGKMISTILAAQKSSDADLIMMGTMGDKITDEAITNTSRLVLDADSPVISIPYGCGIKEPKDIALVMGGELIDNKKLLDTLLDIARTFDSRVHVLTIYKESIYEEHSTADSTENSLEYYLEHFYVEHTFNKNQDVEEGIFNYINEKKIDLLVILPRNHAQNSTPSEGRLTKLLTLHSEIPVLALD